MFDTVNLFRDFELRPQSYWQEAGFTLCHHRFVHNRPNAPRLTVSNFNARSYLFSEFSIPRLLFGHNAVLPGSDTQALDAIESACSYIETITKLPFGPDKIKIRRIDFARDFHIQDHTSVEAISRELFAKVIPNMKRHTIDNSVSFLRKTTRGLAKKISVYPKLDEVLSRPSPSPEAIRAATGKLRLEVRLEGRGLDGLKRSRGGITPMHLVSNQVSDGVIHEAMSLLDFNRILDARKIDFFGTLKSAGFRTRDFHLLGFIETVKRCGPRFFEQPDIHCPKRTFYDYKKRCEELGIWQDLVNSSEVQLAMSNT